MLQCIDYWFLTIRIEPSIFDSLGDGVQEQVQSQTTQLSDELTQLRFETTDLRGKFNLLEQLLATLIDTCGQPPRPLVSIY